MKFLKIAVVACVAIVAAASNAVAGPDAQSVFELLRGKAYDEIYSYFFEDGRSTSTGDTQIRCVDPQSPSENCDRGYGGFAANDLNGDGSSVVGQVYLVTPDSQNRSEQAAVWSTALGKFVLLEDNVSPTDAAQFPTSPFADWADTYFQLGNISYGTYGTDISSATQTIVGYALGDYDCGDCYVSAPFAFPLIWNYSAGNWGVGELLPYKPVSPLAADDRAVGWASSISDNVADGYDREFVAGTVGRVVAPTYPGTNAAVALNASVWTHTSADPEWQREDLSSGKYSEGRPYSGAEDVNDLGQVVGWLAAPFDKRYLSLDDYFDAQDIPGTTDFLSRGAIWLPDDQGGHDNAQLLASGGFTYSEALAIANDGSVVVGWAGDPAANLAPPNAFPVVSHDGPSAVAWLAGPESWSLNGDHEMGTLVDLDASLSGTDRDGLSGSVAEAVDQRGRLVVGKGFYGSYFAHADQVALYWELDSAGNVIAGGSLEQALQAAGVPMTGKDLTLTEARGVRVVYGTDGKPTDVYITGIGTGSFGSWIASLGGGLTTPNEIKKSFTPVKQGTDAVSGAIGGIADDQYCRRPTGTSVADAPWCFFVVGVGDGWVGNNAVGASLAKTFGIAHYFDESTSAGATAGLNFIHGHDEGGSYKALTATVGGYVDHSPETGFQGRASVVLGRVLDATFDRVYANGTGTATSTGSTGGTGAGLFGRIGYATSLDDATRTIPFLEVRLATVNLDAFSDTGGPFNATFDATSQTTGAIRIGIDVEHEVNAQTLLTGGVNATATASTGTGINATVAATPYTVSGSGFGAYVSGNAGVIFQIDPTSSFTGRVDGFAAINGTIGGSALAKYSKLF